MKILIVCKGNTCRSPMYAALLAERLTRQGREATVESAGILESAKGQPAAKEWIDLFGYTRVNLKDHRSRYIGELDLKGFDAIICLEREVFMAVKQLDLSAKTFVYHEEVPNPWQLGIGAYRRCHRVICDSVRRVPLTPEELEERNQSKKMRGGW